MNSKLHKGLKLVGACCLIMQLLQVILTAHYPTKNQYTPFLLDINPSRGLANSIPEDDHLAPRAAWIMSFPLSGEDYVISTIQKLSLTETATNYGNVMREGDGGSQARNLFESIPVFTERTNGPFLFGDTFAMPTKFIPVKTYCDGYCWDCFPGRFARMELSTFQSGCFTATKFVPSAYNNGENGWGTPELVQYETDLITKAALVVRDPFDIIEQRFLYSTGAHSVFNAWIPRFEENARGFHAFCAEAEEKYAEAEKLELDPQVYQDSRGVPCHIEFIKLIFWYNRALEMLASLGLTPKKIYYEDLANPLTYAKAANDVLNFFGLAPIVSVSENKPILLSRSSNYLTDQEKDIIYSLIERIATPDTMTMLRRYF